MRNEGEEQVRKGVVKTRGEGRATNESSKRGGKPEHEADQRRGAVCALLNGKNQNEVG